MLLESGTDINEKDFRGMLPLYMAVKGGRIEIAKMLVEAGADLSKTDLELANQEDIDVLLGTP